MDRHAFLNTNKMNSPEDILGKHCPGFSALFLDKGNKAVMEMYTSILKAMEEYSQNAYNRLSDMDDDFTACKERNLSKDMKIQQLEAVIDQRDTSIKNLLRINEQLNREIEGPDDGLNASHREDDSPRNSGWSV
jgi:hypothetical protein